MESFTYRPYFDALRRDLPWMGLALIAAAAISLLAPVPPPTYSATATIVVEYKFTAPFSVVDSNFTPLFSPDLEAAAENPLVVQAIYDGWETADPVKPSLESLQERLVASLPSQGKGVNLTASATTIQEAIQLANRWEEATIAFLGQELDAVASAGKAQSETLIEEKAAELARFDAQQPTALLEVQLEDARQALKNLYAEKRSLGAIQKAARQARPPEELSARLDIHNQQDGVTPLYIDLTQQNIPQLIALIDRRNMEIIAAEQQSADDLLNLQGQIDQIMNKRDRLLNQYNAAKSIYIDYLKLGVSAHSSLQYTGQLANTAILNKNLLPRSWRTVLASIAGALAVAFLVIAKTWWVQANRS